LDSAQAYNSRDKEDIDKWKEAFLNYWGSARNLLAEEDECVEKRIDEAINDPNVLKILDPTGSNDASNSVVIANPLVEQNGDTNRGTIANFQAHTSSSAEEAHDGPGRPSPR
jgi:hypothetical protein